MLSRNPERWRAEAGAIGVPEDGAYADHTELLAKKAARRPPQHTFAWAATRPLAVPHSGCTPCWLEVSTLVMLRETARHWPSLRDLLGASRISGPQLHDAQIAALWHRHDVSELWTADRDLGRCGGLRFKHALVSAG